MLRIYCIGILSVLLPQFIWANQDRQNKEVIKEYPLDPMTVYSIPIGNTATTITFPGPLLSIDGANVSNTPGTPAPVLLSYVDGRYFFSVKAVQPNAQAAINVVYNNETYAFNFYHREDAIPYRTVKLFTPDQSDPYAIAQTKTIRPISRVGPQILLSLLDRSKNYPLLNAIDLLTLKDDVEYFSPSDLETKYRDFNATIEDIFRYAEYDTLVFRIILRNKTEEDIFYQPQTIAIRVGQNLYFPSIADASGIIPAGSTSIAFVAITSKTNGEPANLSVKNNFKLVVTKITDPAKLIIP